MTLLLHSKSLTKSFGNKVLFTELSMSIFTKDRLGLIGPNGSGKSTFLKILANIETPDSGEVIIRKGIKVGYVPQLCEFPDISIEQILLDTLAERNLSEYDKQVVLETTLSKIGYNNKRSMKASFLSGGWKKRLNIAQAMILSPDLLLLDEPTNHLDLEGILWLEQLLLKEISSYILVSHDRCFLQNVTNRVIEISSVYPKGMFSVNSSYSDFTNKKEEFLQGQIQQEFSLTTKARKEENWLQKTPKARTTKAQSRIDLADKVLKELSDIQKRNRQQIANICFASTQRETNKLLTANNLSKRMGNKILFEQINFTLNPKMRMGLMGPNGSGKTTLLRILAKEILPDLGTIKEADELKVVYFDQLRTKIPPHITLKEALSPVGDYIVFQGQSIHINTWCKRFLFSSNLLHMPIACLSGGEKARISLAHLMLQEADVLLLDEPTNDLDIATLESLETSLIDFPGAVVLITHDRCMLERVCTCLLSLEDTKPYLYADYSQWQAAQKNIFSRSKSIKQSAISRPNLSYLEKKEHQQITQKIEILEQEVMQLNQLLEISKDTALVKLCTEIGMKEHKIEQLYLRWQELEQKKYSDR